jgi:hypothetical protein
LIPFAIDDMETTAENLNLTVSSSNPMLIPNANIFFAGTGTNRTVTLTPSGNQLGSAVITIAVTDTNGASRSESFEVVVVESAPIIVTQPLSQTVVMGAEATFQVVATGSAPLSYQWQHNGIDLPGEINTSLQVIDAQPAKAGDYMVVVTNLHGGATSMVAQLRVLVSAQITQIVRAGAVVQISFTTMAGQTYALEYKDSLDEPRWTALNAVTGTGDILTVNDPAPSVLNRFYRVRSP